MAAPMEREYEFFVTTDERHQPAGEQRNMIRRLVMRNYFETKMARPQLNEPESSSATTVVAKRQLKNRFRVGERGIEIGRDSSIIKKVISEQSQSGKGRPQVRRTRSGPTPSGSGTGDGSSKAGRPTTTRMKSTKRNTSEPAAENPALEIELSAHRIDPFDALPIQGTPQLDFLFRLYQSTPKNNPVAIDPKYTWKGFLLSDAGLLHATVASWALYGVLVNGFKDLRVCKLKHKNEAIKIVNRKLATCGGTVSDEMVGTVLMLANLEVLMGAYDTAQLHISALNRMVEARGGPFAFGHNDGLLRGIIWMDFHTAATLRTPPSFPYIRLDSDMPPLPDELMEEATSTSPTSLLQLSSAAMECFDIFHRLHRLALAASSHWHGRVARLTLSNLLYETQFIILSVADRSRDFLDFDQGVREKQGVDYERQRLRADAASVVEALLAAALIFVYAVLRAVPLNTKIFSVLLSRLRIAVDRPNTQVIEIWKREKNLNILLWVFFIGCSVAAGAEQQWWIAQLSQLCEEMGIDSRYNLEHKMRHVAWTDLFFDDKIDGVWAAVIRSQGHALSEASLAATWIPATTVNPDLLPTRTRDDDYDWRPGE